MTLVTTILTGPLGPMQLVADDDAVRGLYLPRQPPVDGARTVHAASHTILDRAAQELAEYFAGTRTTFDVPVRLDGTAFQREVWAALRAIPFGTTRTYGQIARTVGRAAASRAVGAANARNPISILVPCHRVIGQDGTLTGYAGGEAAKAWLLDHEARGVTSFVRQAESRAS